MCTLYRYQSYAYFYITFARWSPRWYSRLMTHSFADIYTVFATSHLVLQTYKGQPPFFHIVTWITWDTNVTYGITEIFKVWVHATIHAWIDGRRPDLFPITKIKEIPQRKWCKNRKRVTMERWKIFRGSRHEKWCAWNLLVLANASVEKRRSHRTTTTCRIQGAYIPYALIYI